MRTNAVARMRERLPGLSVTNGTAYEACEPGMLGALPMSRTLVALLAQVELYLHAGAVCGQIEGASCTEQPCAALLSARVDCHDCAEIALEQVIGTRITRPVMIVEARAKA